MRTTVTAVATAVAAALAAALPAGAATPVYRGSVGPGFTTSMAKKPTKAGKITLVVSDKGTFHNFHLRGPGNREIKGVDTKTGKAVSRIATSVGGTGTRSFTLTLKTGKYTFVCDPHASSMKGSFTVK